MPDNVAKSCSLVCSDHELVVQGLLQQRAGGSFLGGVQAPQGPARNEIGREHRLVKLKKAWSWSCDFYPIAWGSNIRSKHTYFGSNWCG